MALGFVCSLALMLQTSQDYPVKPVRFIEPFGAGGGPDLVGRALAQKHTELWGQPVMVENVPGARIITEVRAQMTEFVQRGGSVWESN